jgi:hypothetical protein
VLLQQIGENAVKLHRCSSTLRGMNASPLAWDPTGSRTGHERSLRDDARAAVAALPARMLALSIRKEFGAELSLVELEQLSRWERHPDLGRTLAGRDSLVADAVQPVNDALGTAAAPRSLPPSLVSCDRAKIPRDHAPPLQRFLQFDIQRQAPPAHALHSSCRGVAVAA